MGRAPCCEKDGLKKGPWTPEEDQKLVDYIQKHGQGNWRTLPKKAGLSRCGKSCRLRWTNYLRPDIKRGRFSFEEEETIIQLHSILGNKWSAIAARLPGRTDNEIKNYWNTHIRKRLLRMGIDPVTHTPRLDLLDLSSLLTSSMCNPPSTAASQSAASQFDVSMLLGLEPLVNGDLLMLATNLLSSQCQNSAILAQALQKAHQQFPPSCSHVQDQLVPSLHAQQLQYPSPGQLPSTLDEAQLVHTSGDAGNFPTTADSTPWQQDFMAQAHQLLPQCSLTPATAGVSSYGEGRLDQSIAQLVNSTSYMYGHGYNNMASVLSTPASSPTPTPLNSSSTCINSSTEDETDQSYCSNLLKYQIPDLLDVSNCM